MSIQGILAILKKIPRDRGVVWAGWGVIAVSLGSLAAALIAQYGFHMQPCVLCLYQRWPYGLAAALGGTSLLLGRRSFVAGFWTLVPVVPLFVAGSLIGAFQVGVERHWWRGTEGCTGPILQQTLSPEDLLARLEAAPLVPCDVVQFELFGLSMAAYNAILSLGLAGVLSVVLVWIFRRRS